MGGSWSVASSISIASIEFFLYDGWNLVSRVNLNPNLNGTQVARKNFVWGPDIASRPTGGGDWQGAGGVAGLLIVTGTAANDNQFPLMDRMGNVTGYRRATTTPPLENRPCKDVS